MRKFNVSVNGTKYQVEIEEVQAFAAPVAQAPVAAPAPVATSAPVAPKAEVKEEAPAVVEASAVPADGFKVKSPMPGTIVKIAKASGSAVKKGDVIFILEAMKMENDIVSPVDGTITVTVAQGANVSSGDVIAVIA